MKRIISILMALICVFSSAMCVSAASAPKARIYYKHLEPTDPKVEKYRKHYRVTTCYINKSTTGKTKVGEMSNTGKKKSDITFKTKVQELHGYTIEREDHGNIPHKKGASLPGKIVNQDVKATTGYSAKKDEQVTLSKTATLGGHSKKSVYVVYDVIVAKYRWEVTKQYDYGDGKGWVSPEPYTAFYLYETIKVPRLVF